MEISETTVKNILTRTTGFLRTVTSHSLQPYRGCSFGNALCGIGCYVRHNGHVLRGRVWGGFLEVRTNAAESYLANYDRERRWARRTNREGEAPAEPQAPDDVNPRTAARREPRPPNRQPRHPSNCRFSIFCSSATDPFVPQEANYGVTRSVLTAMLDAPPDELVLQTHTHLMTRQLGLIQDLAARCDLRVHVSIETDRRSLPGLPPHASPVERRFEACALLRGAGVRTVVTVSPLLPIDDPHAFFRRIASVADAVVVDHFIQGDGSDDGGRTWRTPLPAAMRAVDPESVALAYRERMLAVARRYLPGRVGVNVDGFAARYGDADAGYQEFVSAGRFFS